MKRSFAIWLCVILVGLVGLLYNVADYSGEILPYQDAPPELLHRQAENLVRITKSIRISAGILAIGIGALIVQGVVYLRQKKRTPRS